MVEVRCKYPFGLSELSYELANHRVLELNPGSVLHGNVTLGRLLNLSCP